MRRALYVVALAALIALPGLPTPLVDAASHREAPLIANDPAADITDFYVFRSWVDPTKVVFIMNVIPAQEPSAGPNYFNFADDVVYAIHVDTNGDGNADDISYEFRFTTEIRVPFNDLPVSYAGVTPTPPGLPPAITALDGAGSEGLGLRQSYTVTRVQGSPSVIGSGLFAVPSNIGPRTMPDYEALAAKGIYALSNGRRVFAGQRDETFYIDLGATFDTLNFRRTPPILKPAEDAAAARNPFGADMFSGFNVNTIAIEVPITDLGVAADAVIGAYASTSRNGTQVGRMANPLVNELIIGTGQKDAWNAAEPENEATFEGFYTTSRLAAVINLAYGTSFPATGRTDLVNALLKYPSQPQTGNCSSNSCSELLRLNLGTSPTDPANQKRLSVLAGDSAGWPNGRRPNDDVTDIALRVVAGALLGPVPNLGDGVNFNIRAPGAGVSDGPGYGSVPGNHLDTTVNGIAAEFPFLPKPHDGRNRRHIDCTEPGARRRCHL
jgi:hypothetical protein